MSKKSKSGKKRNHHYVPKLYLQGFVESGGGPFLWSYRRSSQFRPGIFLSHNPCRMPINKAAMQRDFYAMQKREGGIDYELIENELEKTEKRVDRFLKKVQNLEPIIWIPKEEMSEYIVMMLRRTPSRNDEMKKGWPEFIDEQRKIIMVDSEIREKVRRSMRETQQREVDDNEVDDELDSALSRFEDLPDDVRLPSMLEDLPMTRSAIAGMRWQFLRPPIGEIFYTSDNPVWVSKSHGVGAPYSEMIFPLSSNVCLVGSMHNVIEDYVSVDSSIVTLINKKTAYRSNSYVFAARSEKRILDVVNSASDDGGFVYISQILRR